MTINRKPCGDESRVVKALVDQVSQIQEDISELGNEIDGLDQSKVSKVDLADSVTTGSLTADSANIGGTTITNEQLGTNKASVNDLYSPKADFEYEHANEGYIEALTTDALTVNGDETVVNLNAQRISVADSLTVPDITAEEVSATNVTASGRVSANNVATQTVNADQSNVAVENVSQELNVKDLHITGEITGLNNVDINAKSIDTPVLDADSITTGGIVTSDVNHLIPSPHLDNNDHYTIVLPVFTGTMVLKWADENGNEVWSATVIGNGSDYSIHWGTKADNITVTKLYQYGKHLYIRENANGSLYYSYHTTEEVEALSVLYNYTELDSVVTENYKYDVTVLSGNFTFGSFYAPGFAVQLETIETNKIIIEGEDLVNKHTTTGSIDENLIFRATQHTFDYSESAFDGLFYEVAPFMESEQIPEGAKLIYNDNGTLKFTDSLPTHSGLQFGSPECVAANKEWFNGIVWMPETVTLSDFTYSIPTIKVGNDREVATQEVQSFVDYRENATDALLDLRSAETAAKLKVETGRATTSEATLQASIEAEKERAVKAEENLDENKQDKLPGGEEGQVLTSNGDGTIGWKPGFVLPVGMVIELRGGLNPNDLFTGDWIELQENN